MASNDTPDAPPFVDDFDEMIEEVKQRRDGAVERFLATWGRYALKVIRRRLSTRVRGKVGESDIIQEVFQSFFRRAVYEQTFTTGEELMTFLTVLAQHKVDDVHRQYLDAQKRSVHRETSMADAVKREESALASHEPSAQELLEAKEAWELMMNANELPVQQALKMLRDGYTQKEIAAEVGVDVRTIRRWLLVIATGDPAARETHT